MDAYEIRRRARRRSHPRFDLENVEGELRLLGDATVRIDGDEIVAISDESGAPGEHIGLERVVNGIHVGVTARILDCRLVVIEGTVRHQLRLSPCGQNVWRAGDSDDQPV
jgi:hypothetical protein